MKTFETEKHNIPEGATHYANETDTDCFIWYREDTKEVMVDGYVISEWEGAGKDENLADIKPIPQTNTETPEEKGVEWVNGDKCIYNDEEFTFVSYMCKPEEGHVVIWRSFSGVDVVYKTQISKPETPQQREERERLENGQSLYELVQSLWCTVDSKYTPHPYSSSMVDDKTKEMYARLARAVDYRKES